MTVTRKMMTVLFYRVAGPPPLLDHLQAAAAIREGAARTIEIGGVRFRMEGFVEKGHLFSANVVRVRDSFTPGRTRLDRDGIDDLPLTPEEYLGEETSLLYWKPLDVLVLQANRFGIGAGTLAAYLQHLTHEVTAFPQLVMDDENLTARLAKIHIAKKFEIEIARAGPEKLRALGLSANAIVDLMGASGAETLRVVMKAGRGGALEHIASLANSVQRFVNRDEENIVRAARVSGKTELGDSTLLDLLEPKMLERVSVDVHEGVRRVPHNARLKGLTTALTAREDQLKDLFE